MITSNNLFLRIFDIILARFAQAIKFCGTDNYRTLKYTARVIYYFTPHFRVLKSSIITFLIYCKHTLFDSPNTLIWWEHFQET